MKPSIRYFQTSSPNQLCSTGGIRLPGLAIILLSWLLPAAVYAQAPAQTCSTASPAYCPGASNPLGTPKSAIAFPIDGMMAFAPGGPEVLQPQIQTYVNSLGGDPPLVPITGWSIPGAFSLSNTYAAAAGRIIAPGPQTSGKFGYPEDVVYVWRNGNSFQVDFANPAHRAYGGIQLQPDPTDGTQIVPRLDSATYGPSSDFVTVAVGDLDGTVDSNGEPHDEVVVAFPVVDNSGTWNVEVYVLNFTNATNASGVKITKGNAYYPTCGPACFATASTFTGTSQSQKNILSSGNILSLAIGDFDGDGNNEVALVT